MSPRTKHKANSANFLTRKEKLFSTAALATAIPLAASCNELNGIIDAVGNYQTNIFLEDNCQSNITISANKRINLISRYYKSGSTSLTVEEGATTREREFSAFDGIGDNFPKYILTADKSSTPTSKNGISAIYLPEFLLSIK